MSKFKHEISTDYSKSLYCLRCNISWYLLVNYAEARLDIQNGTYLDFVNRVNPCPVSDDEYIIKKALE